MAGLHPLAGARIPLSECWIIKTVLNLARQKSFSEINIILCKDFEIIQIHLHHHTFHLFFQ